ncbi:MAG TPA: S41 family peptidase [bacterium]|nr:S41 family peptidase [Myxococcales bacterium]HPW45307.1 S41 family peptidase [bacterium]HQG13837.1 S41 family peptidase [bacterium]HQH80436.1 S41 family peptidase [bacterium]
MKSRVCHVLTALLLILVSTRSFAMSDDGYANLHIFSRVLHYIEENYAGKFDDSTLIQGAIRGMLDTLDPHSVYMSPDAYRELKVDTRGRFDGIGIEVSIKGGHLTVISPIKGTPADFAGIYAGDRIVKINGKVTQGLGLSEAVGLMRGKRGSRVVLTINRDGVKDNFDIAVVRRIIKVPSVAEKLIDDRFAYLSMVNFQQGTARAVEKAMKQLRRELVFKRGESADFDGIILDLRKNPGGLLDQAVAVSDLFLSEGTIVSTETRGKEIDRSIAREDGTFPNYPVVVLIDRGSASASEIVAGALQDNKRAVIMGTRSFGKGSVQTVIDLDDGSGLKLTIARYLTPSGKSIQDEGIIPDVIVEQKPPMPKKGGEPDSGAVPVEEKDENDKQTEKRDYQLEKAIEYLNGIVPAHENDKGSSL